MLIFVLGLIIGILLVLSIIFYYKNKEKKKVGEIVFIRKSILTLILRIVNKICKQDFIAITNIFNNRVHIIDKLQFININEGETLYKHELVHIYQVQRVKIHPKQFIYAILYIFNSFKGYSKNKYEVEAYGLEGMTIADIKKHFGR